MILTHRRGLDVGREAESFRKHLGQHLLDRHYMSAGADNVRLECVAGAMQVAVVERHDIVVVASAKRSLEFGKANPVWFIGIPVRFFDFANHAGVHDFGLLFRRLVTSKIQIEHARCVPKTNQHRDALASGAGPQDLFVFHRYTHAASLRVNDDVRPRAGRVLRYLLGAVYQRTVNAPSPRRVERMVSLPGPIV